MSRSNLPGVLPDGWVRCFIGQVTLPTTKINPKIDIDREMQYIDISSIDNIRQVIGNTKRYKLRHAPSRARQVVHSGDTLFSTVRPYLCNIALVPSCYDQEIASTGFSVLRPAKGVCPEFLFYKTISSDFVDRISGMQYGVSYPAVKDEQVRDQELWLPPTTEQHRVVAKIDELFSELDDGIESLKKARTQLSTYRKAVLKNAFEGKLTAHWCEENKDRLETPEQLLTRIKQKREAHYEQQLRAWRTAVLSWEQGGKWGRKPLKPSVFKVTERIEYDELADLPHLPRSWQYVRLSEIADIGSGMSVSESRKLDDPIEVPYLSVANVQRGELDLSRVKTMRIERAQLATLELEQWDVLFNEGGDRDKLGRGWIWESQMEPCITQNHVFRASPFLGSHEHSKWISHWGNSFGQRHFEAQGKQTTNLASINKTVLNKFPIPLPPIREQVEILRRIDIETSTLDHVESSITAAFRNLSALRQSILKTAFNGQLVPQDPRDEPASVLLDRIKTEREQIPSRVMRRKTAEREKTKVTA